MVPIFYVVGAFVLYAVGQITVPKTEVVMMKDGVVVEAKKIDAKQIVVNIEGDNVEVRETRRSAPAPYVNPTSPLHKDSFGQWTADCAPEHCEE